MEKTRANTNGPLDRWYAHRAELTDKALANLGSDKVKQAFRNWVIKGDHAPQYGDALYDHLVCITNGMTMNNIFMFKEHELGDCDEIIYHDCILRAKLGNLPPGMHVPRLIMDLTTLTVREPATRDAAALHF